MTELGRNNDVDDVLCELDHCKQLLKEALPHVEQMANACSTGPIMSKIDHLVLDMEAAILEK